MLCGCCLKEEAFKRRFAVIKADGAFEVFGLVDWTEVQRITSFRILSEDCVQLSCESAFRRLRYSDCGRTISFEIDLREIPI